MSEVNIEKIWPRWKVDGLIGQGAFGSVYRVYRENFDKIFYSAVKYIHIPQDESGVRELISDGMDMRELSDYYKDAVRGLADEISIMESLKGASNIVSIEDYEVEPDEAGVGWNIYIRMELLENLNAYRQRVSMTPSLAARIGIDICTALEYCAQKQIIHRDIKPDNIFVSPFGSFKLGDFGIARHLDGTRATMSQKGTCAYMAPEIFRGERYDATVDTYSLGLVLYRLVNYGRMPFMPPAPAPVRYQDTEIATNRRISGEELPPPDGCDSGLAQILCKAAAPDPAQRYESPSAMKRELERWLKAQPSAGAYSAGGVQPSAAAQSATGAYSAAAPSGNGPKERAAAQPGTQPSGEASKMADEAEHTVLMFPGKTDSRMGDERPDEQTRTVFYGAPGYVPPHQTPEGTQEPEYGRQEREYGRKKTEYGRQEQEYGRQQPQYKTSGLKAQKEPEKNSRSLLFAILASAVSLVALILLWAPILL